MPFDALVMRAIEARFNASLLNATVIRAQCGRDRLLFTVKSEKSEVSHLLIVLQPGLQRIHRTSRTTLSTKMPVPLWLQKIMPFTIRRIEVPLWERVMILDIEYQDDWAQPIAARLIIELAGHLTNLIATDPSGQVIDAWRKISPGRPGRTVWPKLPYEPPPRPVADGLSPQPESLPPWAKRWLSQGGEFNQLMHQWREGFPGPGFILTNRTSEEVWLYPMEGFQAAPLDLERALDSLYERREIARQEEQLRGQLTAQIQGRINHLGEKVSQYRIDGQEDESHWKMIGDLWLTYQSSFKNQKVTELTVDGYDGQAVTLTVTSDTNTPADQARDAYRRYKKIKARKEALTRLIPILENERAALQALLDTARDNSQPLDWYRAQLKKTSRPSADPSEREPYRHFKSLHGLDIWVGRNRDENARLTFKQARPDDIWLHTKQAPGSHVILGSGKTNPDLEDLLDAAELAVFFSSAAASSTVPVDYTRRKFVRKRPHAEPGQVLYQREKTLYITPNSDRLRRLGAVSEKLVDD